MRRFAFALMGQLLVLMVAVIGVGTIMWPTMYLDAYMLSVLPFPQEVFAFSQMASAMGVFAGQVIFLLIVVVVLWVKLHGPKSYGQVSLHFGWDPKDGFYMMPNRTEDHDHHE